MSDYEINCEQLPAEYPSDLSSAAADQEGLHLQSSVPIPDAQQETQQELCPCCRKKDRSDAEIKDMLNRLSRIEGQIRGIRKMVESDAYCIDILTQVSAASSALNSFTRVLLGNHIRTCVTEDIQQGSQEKMEELLKVLPKLMK